MGTGGYVANSGSESIGGFDIDRTIYPVQEFKISLADAIEKLKQEQGFDDIILKNYSVDVRNLGFHVALSIIYSIHGSTSAAGTICLLETCNFNYLKNTTTAFGAPQTNYDYSTEYNSAFDYYYSFSPTYTTFLAPPQIPSNKDFLSVFVETNGGVVDSLNGNAFLIRNQVSAHNITQAYFYFNFNHVSTLSSPMFLSVCYTASSGNAESRANISNFAGCPYGDLTDTSLIGASENMYYGVLLNAKKTNDDYVWGKITDSFIGFSAYSNLNEMMSLTSGLNRSATSTTGKSRATMAIGPLGHSHYKNKGGARLGFYGNVDFIIECIGIKFL